jgi:hypothetical protein
MLDHAKETRLKEEKEMERIEKEFNEKLVNF